MAEPNPASSSLIDFLEKISVDPSSINASSASVLGVLPKLKDILFDYAIQKDKNRLDSLELGPVIEQVAQERTLVHSQDPLKSKQVQQQVRCTDLLAPGTAGLRVPTAGSKAVRGKAVTLLQGSAATLGVDSTHEAGFGSTTEEEVLAISSRAGKIEGTAIDASGGGSGSKKSEGFRAVTDWRRLFNEPKASAFNLSFKAPTVENGRIIVEPPIEVVQAGSRRWENAIVGQFIDKKPSFFAVQKAVQNMWAKGGSFQIFTLDNGTFIFKFDDSKVRERVLENGVWTVAGKPMVVYKWRQDLEPMKFQLTTLPIWVKLFNVPPEYWTEEGISCVASAVGKPLYVDAATEGGNQMGYMKVCVEVEVGDTLPNYFPIRRNGKEIIIKVEYLWKPAQCTKCKVFGHSTNSCKAAQLRVEPNKRREEVEGAKEEVVAGSSQQPNLGKLQVEDKKVESRKEKESGEETDEGTASVPVQQPSLSELQDKEVNPKEIAAMAAPKEVILRASNQGNENETEANKEEAVVTPPNEDSIVSSICVDGGTASYVPIKNASLHVTNAYAVLEESNLVEGLHVLQEDGEGDSSGEEEDSQAQSMGKDFESSPEVQRFKGLARVDEVEKKRQLHKGKGGSGGSNTKKHKRPTSSARGNHGSRAKNLLL